MEAKLERTTFRTSRLLEFCSEKELTSQTGHERDKWPLVILKELVDNSLDACEEFGVPPQIKIKVDAEGITIRDNGPGVPVETVEGVLNYAVRVSNREAYVSPTRGAQGNALKTILAMPFVLNGNCGRVDIGARGQQHEISFSVDPIRQEPMITRATRQAQDVKKGTCITVWWPDSACSELRDAEAQFLQLADDYTVLNPHLTMAIEWFGRKSCAKATDTNWRKWGPSEPTSPHWYGREHLERLIAAYVAHDRDRDSDRSVREFVKEFRGLTASAKQKAVLEATGLSRTNLSHLANGHGLDHEIVENLLVSMQQHTKPVKPVQLGVIGKDHLVKRFQDMGCEMESFRYKKVAEVDDDGLPTVVETAFGWRGEESEEERRIITGLNWSPGIVNPFRTLGDTYGDGLGALLERQHAGENEPIIFFLHCACPRIAYTDRGKSAVVMK